MTNEDFNKLNRAQSIQLLREYTTKANKRLKRLSEYERKHGLESPALKSARSSNYTAKNKYGDPYFPISRNIKNIPLQYIKEKLARVINWLDEPTSTNTGFKELRNKRYQAFLDNTDESLHEYITKDTANSYYTTIDKIIQDNPDIAVSLYGSTASSKENHENLKEIYFRSQGVLTKDEIENAMKSYLDMYYRKGNTYGDNT